MRPRSSRSPYSAKAALVPLTLAALTLLLPSDAVAAEPPVPEAADCDRAAGNLTRYLLCIELQARRPAIDHPRYYADLERIELGMLDVLPGGKARRRRNLLPQLYHARRDDTAFVPQQTLVDALDWRRADRFRRLAADCDVFSLINAGVAERYFGRDYPTHRVLVARTRHDHVVNAFARAGRLVGVLETEDGSTFVGAPGTRDEHSFFRPMSEAEVVSMYLAHVGLALAREGREQDALAFLDDALRLNPTEYVANAARALTLLLAVAVAPDRQGQGQPWCAGPDNAPMLESASQAALQAMRIEPTAVGPHSLLGKIRLHQCRSAQARPHLQRAVQLGGDPLDRYYLGLVLSEEAQWDETIRTVRRGRRQVRSSGDRRYRPLQLEMEFLLAQAYARRAHRDESPRDLRRALHLLDTLRRSVPGDEQVALLELAIEQLDYRLGPVRRDFGLPRALGRKLYHANFDD